MSACSCAPVDLTGAEQLVDYLDHYVALDVDDLAGGGGAYRVHAAGRLVGFHQDAEGRVVLHLDRQPDLALYLARYHPSRRPLRLRPVHCPH